MLEIVAQILCTLLALGGINFIVQALFRLSDINAGALLLSLAAGIISIGAAVYFYGVIDSQASGARQAMDDLLGGAEHQRELLRQQSDPPVEPVMPTFHP